MRQDDVQAKAASLSRHLCHAVPVYVDKDL